MSIELLILILYSIAILSVGLWTSRKVHNTEDYLLAGRRLGLGVLVGTLVMTEFNTMSLVGFTGFGYKVGVYGTMIALMFPISFIFYMLVFAKRWKRFNAFTTSQMFEDRFASPAMARTVSVLWLIALLLSVPNYLTGAALIVGPSLGLSFQSSVFIISITVLVFTMLGGLRSVAYTDYASMLLALVVFPVFFWYSAKGAGGWQSLIETFQAINPNYTHWNGFNMREDPILNSTMLLGWLFACFWVFQLAQWYGQRMFAAKSERAAYWAMAFTAAIVFVGYAAVILIAAFVRVVNPNIANVETEPPIAWAIVNFVDSPIWRGLIYATVFAVCQTTVSSVWNVMVSMISQDLWKGWLRPQSTDQDLLKMSRWLTILLAGWTIFGAIFIIHGFTGVVRGLAIANVFMFIPAIPCFLAFVWRRYNRNAAWLTMIICGVLSMGIVGYKGIYLGQFFFFEVFFVTALIALGTGIGFGWLLPAGVEESVAREKFYRRVGDPWFRSGHARVFTDSEQLTPEPREASLETRSI